MRKGEDEFGLIASPLEVKDTAAMLSASRIDLTVESHKDEVCEQCDYGVVECRIES